MGNPIRAWTAAAVLLSSLPLTEAPGLRVSCASVQDAPSTPGSAEALRLWAAEWEQRQRFQDGTELEYARLVRAALAEAVQTRPNLEAVGTILLDLASWGLEGRPETRDYAGTADRHKVRRRARSGLEELLEGSRRPDAQTFLAEVLASRGSNPPLRRLVALDLLVEDRTSRGKLAMLTVARDEDDPLRGDVIEELATWPDEAVDSFLVGLIGKKFDREKGPHPFNVLLKRIREVDQPLGQRATDLLSERLRVTLLSSDWREASRSIELARGMEPKYGVPLLLDALSAWTRREQHGGGSRRILNDIILELRRISGKSIGRNPKNWITWWIAVRQGRAELADPNYVPDEPKTEATFFGLRPMTDQVTFVIDYSGSMGNEWGTSEHSRYVEAIEQVMRFLQASGQQTKFNVILFNDQPMRSSPHLVRATTRNLTQARESLLRFEPGGGTYLRPGVELALRLDSSGMVDPERLEADTIVVLCDGETQDGAGWVRPLLRRVNGDARVVFHCVLIGTRGDGTLERLAEETGGDFLRIGG